MTYIVTDNCIRCKYMDCVEVCPVDCFYEGENMLVIHPDECIDCGVCEPECPVDAIRPDTEPGLEQWLSLNAEYAGQWPNITIKRDPPPDAAEHDNEPGNRYGDIAEARQTAVEMQHGAPFATEEPRRPPRKGDHPHLREREENDNGE